MHGQELGSYQSRMESLQARLTQWRKKHGGRGRRIPEAIWIEAAEVARVEGIELTARLLRLNRDRLEEHVVEGCRPCSRDDIESTEFVEVALPHTLSSGQAMIMLANSHGDELCIIDMAGNVDIRALLRDFWSRR